MSNTDITQERLLELVTYDPYSGVMLWIKPYGKAKKNGGRVGTKLPTRSGKDRLQTNIGGRYYLVHRLAWLYVHGKFPENQIDHINGDSMDNRIENLREATSQQNTQNRRQANRNKNGKMLGAYWRKDISKWMAQIALNGKDKFLGFYKTELEAHNAYVNAKRELHQFCTI